MRVGGSGVRDGLGLAVCIAIVVVAHPVRGQDTERLVASGAPPAPAVARCDTSEFGGANVDGMRGGQIVLSQCTTDETAVRTGYAATLVHRPVAQVIHAIHDVNHYRNFIPQFEQSQELSHGAHTQDLFVRVAVSNFAHLWARIRYQDATSHGVVTVSGRALQGNVQRMDIRWRATPVDGGAATLLELWSLVVPQFPIPLPAALIDGEQQSTARRGIEAVRHRVENEAASSGAPAGGAARGAHSARD